MAISVSMKVNGKPVSGEVEARTLLVQFLRENLQLTGTHVREHHGLQCGFCTPGMVMSAIDLVKHDPKPDEHTIREWLEGNICRCTGYHNIVKAIKAGAEKMGAA